MAVSGVGVTAVAVAAARALESDRGDALIDDPWAAMLVRASGVTVPFPEHWPADGTDVAPLEQSLLLGATYIGLRTRFIDDELRSSGITQIVVLGSGLDTRAWRLDWPTGTEIFELDSADVLDFLTATMGSVGAKPRAVRAAVAADITAPWASKIVAAGFSPGHPTHWVLEGVLPYLSADDQRALLDDIVALSAAGSRVVIERAAALTDSPETRDRLRDFSAATGIPFDELLSRTDPPDPGVVLARAGWSPAEASIADLEHRYARSLSDDREGPRSDRGGFVIAHLPGSG